MPGTGAEIKYISYDVTAIPVLNPFGEGGAWEQGQCRGSELGEGRPGVVLKSSCFRKNPCFTKLKLAVIRGETKRGPRLELPQ